MLCVIINHCQRAYMIIIVCAKRFPVKSRGKIIIVISLKNISFYKMGT